MSAEEEFRCQRAQCGWRPAATALVEESALESSESSIDAIRNECSTEQKQRQESPIATCSPENWYNRAIRV